MASKKAGNAGTADIRSASTACQKTTQPVQIAGQSEKPRKIGDYWALLTSNKFVNSTRELRREENDT